MSLLTPKSYPPMPKVSVITTQCISSDQLISYNTAPSVIPSKSISGSIEIDADGMLGDNLKKKLWKKLWLNFHIALSCGISAIPAAPH